MMKQKAVALLYGDGEELYAEIPCWVLVAQLSIPDSAAILKTCPSKLAVMLMIPLSTFSASFGHFLLVWNHLSIASRRRGHDAEAQLSAGHQFRQTLLGAMERNMRDSSCFAVTLFDHHNSEFEATQTSPTCGFSLNTYRVSLRNQTCDCGYFQALHYPCMHAVECCVLSRVNWVSYVNDMYQMTEVFSVYRLGFSSPIPDGYWPPYGGPTIIPNLV
ncbi:hypothetical protein PIB30_003206 [Stylosanthes scabra]|uniref:SWIM-type domain-containing protein n=1 Tax=Stylosanthes scabra TaxID=79078 RepID=A0ABU6Q354_9FABA|nr:hypothetical protein [Stylosanthes scabra]